MVINYEIDIDLANPGATHRIEAKQGDVMSRSVYVKLLANGESFTVNRTAQAVIRYCVQNADGQIISHGLYDTLEDGSPAYLLVGNTVAVTPIGAMTQHPGLVTVDVLLVEGVKQLATFNFEIYVNPAPTTGTVAQNQNYYRIASLDAINTELNALRNAITAMGGGAYLT